MGTVPGAGDAKVDTSSWNPSYMGSIIDVWTGWHVVHPEEGETKEKAS